MNRYIILGLILLTLFPFIIYQNQVFGDETQEFQMETDKINYVLGDTINFNGIVPTRLFEENHTTQTPIIIIISNENHEWVPKITPDKNLNYHTGFSLSEQLGFTEGTYHVFASYGNYFKTTDFTVGKQFSTSEPTKQESTFTITTDKEKYAFGDRALFTGYLKNLKVSSYADVNIINIQILDEDKNLLQSKFYTRGNNAKLSSIPSLYEFNAFPRTGTGYAIAQDIGINKLKTLEPNEYRFSVSITPRDFIENKTYHAVATYGKEKIETSFVVYDKFAHMTDLFEIYLDDTNYSLGDTVTITGLAPHAVAGGGGSSKEVIKVTIDKPDENSQGNRDNSYVMYTISEPDGEKETGQIKVENGEFIIDYKISEYAKSDDQYEKYTIQTKWSNHYQDLDFIVQKPLKEYNRLTYYDNVHDCEAQIEFIHERSQTHLTMFNNAILLEGHERELALEKAKNYKIDNVNKYQLTDDCK